MKRVQTLMPCLVAVVVLGLTPVGTWLAGAISAVTGLGGSVSLALAYTIVIVFGTVAMPLLRLRFVDEEPSRIDSFLGVSDRNGQAFFTPLLLITSILAVLTIVVIRDELVTIGCALAAGILGIAPEWILGRKREPPEPVRIEITLPEPKAEEAGEVLERLYAWTFIPSLGPPGQSRRFSMSLRIPKAVFDRYAATEHPMRSASDKAAVALPTFVRDGLCDEVTRCATELARMAREQDLPYLDFVDFVLAFVRGSIEYARDPEVYGHAEYFAFPVETLVNQRGDCDDDAILAASLLTTLGLDTILVLTKGHVGIGVALPMERPGRWIDHNGRKYYYGEATPGGDWRLGEVPEEHRRGLVPISIS